MPRLYWHSCFAVLRTRYQTDTKEVNASQEEKGLPSLVRRSLWRQADKAGLWGQSLNRLTRSREWEVLGKEAFQLKDFLDFSLYPGLSMGSFDLPAPVDFLADELFDGKKFTQIQS